MGRGVVDAPLNEVAEYINRFQTRFEWDNLLVVSMLHLHPMDVWFSSLYRNLKSANVFQRMIGSVSVLKYSCTCTMN